MSTEKIKFKIAHMFWLTLHIPECILSKNNDETSFSFRKIVLFQEFMYVDRKNPKFLFIWNFLYIFEFGET